MNSQSRVVIIGAGASGAAFAWRLAQQGVKSICLERGDWLNPNDIPTDQADWEYRRITDFSPNPNVRKANSDYPILDANSEIKPLMYNGVGGSTIMWSAHTPRFRPSDFKINTLDGVGFDWPISYWDLAPYYEINDAVMGTSGVAGDPGNPPRTPRDTPALPYGVVGTKMANAATKLGWHWWPSDGNILATAHGDRPGCNNCGPCEMGCRIGARASVDITYWPKAIAMGAELVLNACVSHIEVDSKGLANKVIWFDQNGTQQATSCDYVVMAANGIGTPRILLNSVSKEFPNGLANSSGQVGRNFMLHPIAGVSGVWDEPVQSWAGNDAFCLLTQHFYETDSSRTFKRGYEMQVTRGQGPLISALGGFGLNVPWGQGHHERFDQVFGHVATVAVTCEDLPTDTNFVSIDSQVTDRFGVPAAVMNYELEENAKQMKSHGIESAKAWLTAAGAREVLVNPLLAQAGFHLMGTTRMGTDPNTSVVGQDCRAHDVPNLLVIDASVFASSAAVNPTPTLQAIAIRAADQLVKSGL